jgi:hypothetical protein
VTGDLGLAIGTERAFQAQQLVMRPRGEHMAVASPHEHLTVISKAELANLNVSDALAGHRFDWIAPQFFDKHSWLHRSLTGIHARPVSRFLRRSISEHFLPETRG